MKNPSLTTTVTFETDGFDEFDVEVEFDYEGPSHSDHPYGSGTAREDHPASASVILIKTADAVVQLDENERILKIWPKGTDVTTLPGWKMVEKMNMKFIENEIHVEATRRADDAAEELECNRQDRED